MRNRDVPFCYVPLPCTPVAQLSRALVMLPQVLCSHDVHSACALLLRIPNVPSAMRPCRTCTPVVRFCRALLMCRHWASLLLSVLLMCPIRAPMPCAIALVVPTVPSCYGQP
jgi:hypothetical protein